MKTTEYVIERKSIMCPDYWHPFAKGKKSDMLKELKAFREHGFRTYRLVRVTTTREVIKG